MNHYDKEMYLAGFKFAASTAHYGAELTKSLLHSQIAIEKDTDFSDPFTIGVLDGRLSAFGY